MKAVGQQSPLGYFAVLFLVNLMWAFQFSGAKIATERLGPITVTLIPLARSTLLFMPFALVDSFKRKQSEAVDIKASVWGFIAAGTLGVTAAQLGLTSGVQRSLASNASVLTLTIPVMTAVLAALLLGERMTRLRWVSFVLALVGVLMVSDIKWGSVQVFESSYLLGNLLILVGCFGSAFYNTYSKKLLRVFSPVEVLFYSFLVTDVVLVALMIYTGVPHWSQLAGLGLKVWLSLGGIAFLSLTLAMVLFFWVIKRIDVTQASLSVYLLPVFGVLISTVAVHEKPTWRLLAGGALVCLGTFLVTTYEERARIAQESAKSKAPVAMEAKVNS